MTIRALAGIRISGRLLIWSGVAGVLISIFASIALGQTQGAKNGSYATSNAEEDNVDVPVYKANTTSFRITATHPTYTSTLDGRSADAASVPVGPMIWQLGVDDGSSAEFPYAPVVQGYSYYPPENPPVGRSDGLNLMPQRYGANGVNFLTLYYTLKDGYEKNNDWKLTIDFADVTGLVGVSLTYYIGDPNNPYLWEISSGQRMVFSSSNKTQSFVFNPGGGGRYWRPGTDQLYVRLQFSSDTAGASAVLDSMKLQAIVPGIWSAGSLFANGRFKASGYSNGGTYYVQDFPAAGTDQPASECPQELSDGVITDQYLRFTTALGTPTKVGGTYSVTMASVTGSLVARLSSWNGTSWVDRGTNTFTSTSRTQNWTLPDGAFLDGVDANQFWLHVVGSSEAAAIKSTAGAKGIYGYMNLKNRSLAADQFTTLFDNGDVKIVGVKTDGWWQSPNAMTVSVTGGSSLAGAHYLQVYKQIPGVTGTLPPQVFVLYQDGNARIIPFRKTTQTLDPPFGSSVIIGPAAESKRPFVDIASASIDPQNLTADLTYRDGKKALLTIAPAADRSKTAVDVSHITYDTVNRPIATLRSMWVANGNSDVDTIQTSASETPILGAWSFLDDVSWFFKRKFPSQHNTWAPDIRIDQTGATAPPPTVVNFASLAIVPYGGASPIEAQDNWGFHDVYDNGATLRLTGNRWKAVAVPYTITPRTVVEFDFLGDTRAEISGFGFDEDLNDSSSTRVFELVGTQTWGIQAYHDWVYNSATWGWKHYVIPIGQFYTGPMNYMFFCTDDDDYWVETASDYFKNVVIHE
ncbi:MAG: hypothetical protein JO317_02480 [Verrucomicrobiae bacterium]|nr:hypothetical protein [Verrucomicrobiae bacterium]